MTPFEEFFGGNVFVINLQRRPDRLRHFSHEMERISVRHWQRFEAIDAGKDWGNTGCTASHRALMDLIVQRGLRRAFIFEDDATVREQFLCCFHMTLAHPLRELPEDWEMIYLGGHYGSDPQGWHSKHLIRIGQMKTTSSYGVTLESAAKLRDIIPIGTHDSIDNIYGGFNEVGRCYISEPRLFVQYENYSDLQKREMSNVGCMEDMGHISRLGKYVPR